jgi:hypothetical protein
VAGVAAAVAAVAAEAERKRRRVVCMVISLLWATPLLWCWKETGTMKKSDRVFSFFQDLQ